MFVCQNCGAVYPKWQGKCDTCNEWNTIVEENVKNDGFSKLGSKKEGHIIDFVPLRGTAQIYSRLQTGIKEIDRVVTDTLDIVNDMIIGTNLLFVVGVDARG